MRKEILAGLTALVEATRDTGINIDINKGELSIYWNGVNDLLDCTIPAATDAIIMLRRLEALGMKDC